MVFTILEGIRKISLISSLSVLRVSGKGRKSKQCFVEKSCSRVELHTKRKVRDKIR